MYIRDTLSYTPTTDPNTNITTTPPKMPEWTLDTDLISDLLTPIAIAGGLALAFFGEGKKFTNPAQNIIGGLAKTSKYGPKDVALFILDYALFFVDPGLGSYVMLVYQSIAFSAFIFGVAEIVVKSTQNEFFLILSCIMLLVSLAIIIRDLIEHKLHGPVGDWLEDTLQNLINRFGRK